jgi:3alpha(or 20beta)-hydroxysteroid dehydrogenase
VNNAAVLHIGTLENTPPEAFRRLFEVNTLGPYLGTRAVLPTMKAQAAGSIVHISSIDGLVGMNGVTAYASSKWGLRGLAKASAMELGRSGIRVNTICPASGNAEMFDPWQEKMASFPDDIAAYLANRAMPGELPAEAVAGAVNYLLSDSSRHVTGIDLPVDAGATVGRFLPGFNTL